MAIDHDRLFKELIRTYFKEFIQLFFPEAYKAIDFDYVNFLSEEVFTDVVKGSKRKVDVLIETKLKGETALIIVHFESQAQFQEDFPDRMFVYFSRLYEKYRRKILPIAIFSYDEKRDEESSFKLAFSFLDVCKMSYTKEERVQVKIEFLRMLVRLEVNPARMKLITGFFDTYLVLNDIEERQLQEGIQMLDPEEEEKIMELKSNWEKTAELRGELKGKIQGKLEGKLEGKVEEARKFISKFIQAQFEDESKEMLAKVVLLTNLDILERLADRLFRYSGLEEAKRLVEEAFEEQKTLN
jgi:hypothetical protein